MFCLVPYYPFPGSSIATSLVEGVGAGAPVGEEDGKTDGLEDAGKGANGDLLKRALLGGDLGNEL